MKICPNCHDANSCGDYEGPTCDVCHGEGRIPDAKILPCPFCGCAGWLMIHGGILDGGNPGFRIECVGKCHSMTTYWHTETKALEAWNQRVIPNNAAA